MNIQYIYDSEGNKTSVVIPIADWDELKRKYDALTGSDDSSFTIPDWHKQLIDQELQQIANGTAGLTQWDDAKRQLRF